MTSGTVEWTEARKNPDFSYLNDLYQLNERKKNFKSSLVVSENVGTGAKPNTAASPKANVPVQRYTKPEIEKVTDRISPGISTVAKKALVATIYSAAGALHLGGAGVEAMRENCCLWLLMLYLTLLINIQVYKQ